VPKDGDKENRGDGNLLFPPSSISLALPHSSNVGDVLGCRCQVCRGTNIGDLLQDPVGIEQIFQSEDLRRWISVLAWIGVGCAMRHFVSMEPDSSMTTKMRSFCQDRTVDFLSKFRKSWVAAGYEETVQSIAHINLEKDLSKRVERAERLIKSVKLRIGIPIRRFEPTDNLPYLEKRYMRGGAWAASVVSFRIHVDFCEGPLKV